MIRIDAAAGVVEAEGMIPYVALADATLAQGAMPAVVPQLKSITLGGAVAGVGIEASSFRHGLVHDTVTALDVLTADGRIVHCTPDNEHRDLFFGFPNSYGTLGYALAVTREARPGQALRAPRARPPFRSRRLLRRDRPRIAPTAASISWTAPCSRPTKCT